MKDVDEPEQLPLQPDDLLGRPLIGQIRKARFSLYGSHALAAWGQRSWEFAVGLIMLEVWPQSLVLVSAYGLADQASQVNDHRMVGPNYLPLPRDSVSRPYKYAWGYACTRMQQ